MLPIGRGALPENNATRIVTFDRWSCVMTILAADLERGDAVVALSVLLAFVIPIIVGCMWQWPERDAILVPLATPVYEEGKTVPETETAPYRNTIVDELATTYDENVSTLRELWECVIRKKGS